MEEMKPTLLADDMVIYIDIQGIQKKKGKEKKKKKRILRISEFSRVAGTR